jgi:hypothetical protein
MIISASATIKHSTTFPPWVVLAGALETIKRTGFDIPIFLVVTQDGGNHALDIYKQLQDVLLQVNGVFDLSQNNLDYYGHQLETAAKSYEDTLLPPFFNALKQYYEAANATFACPGHQGGQFFRKHPAAGSSSTSLAKHCFAPTCATPTSSSAIC